jgi:uncharacterized protein DUF6748
MLRRRVGGWLLVASLAAGLLAGPGTSSPAPPHHLYRVRPDPRLCPSPMCGGYFVASVDATPTTCYDGVRRPACYVAAVGLDALPATSRSRARAALAAPAALAEGRLVAFRSNVAPRLAALAAHAVWRPAGSAGESGETIFRVVDTGIRCIRAPCFSLRATAAETGRVVRLSGVDLDAPGVTSGSLRRATDLLGRDGVLVGGSLRADREPGWPAAGRVLDAAQVWLPA